MSLHFILLLVLWPAVSAVLSEEVEIENNYMTPIQVCTLITAPNVTTNENGTQLLELEGKVSVIFKLTPIKQYQHQVTMFQRLLSRFARNGFEHLNFVLITSAGSFDKTILKLFTNDISSYITGNVTLIEEESTDENAPHLLVRGNQVIVVDQCQRLTYLVVPPWSFIEYPYVKASVLSTIYDNPCDCFDGPQVNPIYHYGVDDYTNYYQAFNTSADNETTTTDGDDRFYKMTTNSDYSPQKYTDMPENSTTTEEIATEPPAEFSVGNDFNASNASKIFLEDIETMVREDIDFLNNNDVEQNLQVLDEYPDASQNPDEDIEDITNYVMKSTYNENANEDATIDGMNFPMLKITLPTLHMHQDQLENGTVQYTKYEYIVLQMGDPNYHAHHDGDGEVLTEIKLLDENLPSPPSNHIQAPSGPKWDALRTKTDRVFVNQQGDVFRPIKQLNVQDQVFEELQIEFTEITQSVETKDENNERQDDMKRHYEKLVPWLSYRFKV